MTPREKAKDIYEEYAETIPGKTYGVILERDWVAAKACAIIHVNGIIEATNKFADYWDFRNGEWYKDEIANLQSVLKEIENL